MEIEQVVKSQYAQIFRETDWQTFKMMADYYLETAARILKKDINIDYKLMGRNIQKRLFIGIGTELLLKALFLKNDYCINKLREGCTGPKKPIVFSLITTESDLNDKDTYTLNPFIDNIENIITTDDIKKLKKGLKIAKVFRNKEGHVAVLWHKFDPQNYTDIENSIKEIYEKGFNEKLDFQISFENDEEALFSIKKIDTFI